MNDKTVLSLEKIFHNYAHRAALRGVDFTLFEGEVHGLIGEHRAGKSSLVNIIAGALRPHSGIIRIGHSSYSYMTPQIAMDEKVAIVYQNNNIIPDYNAVEYLYSGKPIKNWWGKLKHSEMQSRARELFDSMEYSIDLETPLYRLSVAQQYMVEFARTIITDSKIIILDEIAQKLTPGEMKIVYNTMSALKKQGVSFIYISHDLDEILKVSDHVTILKNGIRIGTEKTSKLDKYKLFELSYSYSVEQENRDDLRKISFLRDVLESTTDRLTEGMLILEEEDRIFYFNPSLKSMFPEISSGWLGKRLQETIFPEIFDSSGVFSGEFQESEFNEITLTDGRIISVTLVPRSYFPGLNDAKVILFRDDSFKSGLDDYMVETEKYASLAELAVGVAHEINNPLFIVKNNLKLIELKSTDRDAGIREKMRKMGKELDRIGGIVSNLLSFSRTQPPLDVFDLHNLLTDVLDLIHHKLIEKRIDFASRFDKSEVKICGDANRLKQVFLNIIINSIDAVLPQGTIEVTTRLVANGNRVRILVADNGYGIDDAVKDKIMTPFFSTKITKSNTGLGLAISKKIIDELNGSLEFESTPGKGAVFSVTLPVEQSGEVPGPRE